LATRPEWVAAFEVFKTHNQLAQRALQTRTFYDKTLSATDSVTFDSVRAMHDVMFRHRSASDLATARRTLDRDGNAANRTMALLVLSTFVDRDSAWWAVADALRDPSNGMVNGTASQVLHLMAVRAARQVDWAPMARELGYIVDGTNLFAFDETLRTLTSTSVSPSLGPTLLANGGALIRAKLRSGDQAAKAAARGFLLQLSGLTGANDAALEAWLDGAGGSSAARPDAGFVQDTPHE
jgi:hypothetical protein